jgi:uncharacterized protein
VQKPEPRKHPKSNSDRCPRGAWWAIFIAAILAFAGGIARAAETPIPSAPERWVTDRAALLSPAARIRIDGKLESYERQTGHQVVVWIGDTIGDTPLDDFAVKTFKAWQLGRKGKDDGVLLLVLAKDRKMAIEVGYGLEPQVPDAIASHIINDVMAPKLRAGDADGAVDAGVDAILQSIEGKPFEHAPGAGTHGVDKGRPGTIQVVGFGILAFAFLVLFITNPRLAMMFLYVLASGRREGRGGGGLGGGGGFSGGGGRSGGGGARGSW